MSANASGPGCRSRAHCGKGMEIYDGTLNVDLPRSAFALAMRDMILIDGDGR